MCLSFTMSIVLDTKCARNEFLLGKVLQNTVVIVMREYMSIAVRSNMHFVCITTVARVDTQ